MDIITGYLFAVNIVSFILYGIDKYKAKRGEMAHIRGNAADDGCYRRQRRSLDWYESMASQDNGTRSSP